MGEYQIFEVLKKYHKSYIDAKNALNSFTLRGNGSKVNAGAIAA